MLTLVIVLHSVVNSYPRSTIAFLQEEKFPSKSNENLICTEGRLFSFALLTWVPVGINCTENCRNRPRKCAVFVLNNFPWYSHWSSYTSSSKSGPIWHQCYVCRWVLGHRMGPWKVHTEAALLCSRTRTYIGAWLTPMKVFATELLVTGKCFWIRCAFCSSGRTSLVTAEPFT